MASYREHLTASSMLGVGVGVTAASVGFTPVQAVLAGCFTGIGGILPDLDSESGRPVREVFSLTAALAPTLMMQHLLEWGGDTESAMLLAIMIYVSIRYGAAWLLGLLAVHRGMFHSIPAMLIAGELAFLGYKSHVVEVKLLMGIGVMIGFFSHLLLDEIYAVEWTGTKIRLNQFAGSAVKLVGKSWPANIFTYGLLFTLSFGVWEDNGLANFVAKMTRPSSVTNPEMRYFQSQVSNDTAPDNPTRRN